MDQCWADLYAAVARQAVHDLHSDYTHPRHMDAARWLDAAGLLDQAQRSPPRRIYRTNVLKGVRIMATLNQDEQAKVDALAALEQAKWNGERYVPDVELANARQLVAYAEANAEAREQRAAHLKAEEDKKTAAVTVARDALARAAQAEYMRARHAAFKGTAAQWEQMKGAILQDFLLGANEGRDEVVERKRASMEYGF